jgi:hypothetical protein
MGSASRAVHTRSRRVGGTGQICFFRQLFESSFFAESGPTMSTAASPHLVSGRRFFIRWAVRFFLGVALALGGASLPAQTDWEWVSGGGFNDVVHDGSRFVAVGYDGVVATSLDGAAWSAEESGEGLYAEAIAHRPGLYVVVGGLGQIFTSPDAVTWTSRSSGTT